MLSFLCHIKRKSSVTRGGIIMEKKIIYLKTLQIVLILAFIWQLHSLHQICGTFADPKAFIHDISIGHCKSFTLIGNDSKTGEFGAVFDHHKWHNQLTMISTNGQPIEEQQHNQFMDELAAKLPPAGRLCIPITISSSDRLYYLIGMDKNPLKKLTLFHFSDQLFVALYSFLLCYAGLLELLLHTDEEDYEGFGIYWYAVASIVCWCCCAEFSFKLMFYWTDFWTCVNFRADYTNVPLVTLVICIVMVCLYAFEIFLHDAE